MRDLKAVGAERGSERLQRPPSPARPPGARGRGPGEGGRRRAAASGSPGLQGCGNFPSRGARLGSGANFAKSPPGKPTPALLRSGAQGGGPGRGDSRATPPGLFGLPPAAAAEPNGQPGLRRAPLTLVAMAGGSRAPLGRLVSRAAERASALGGWRGRLRLAAAARRGGAAAPSQPCSRRSGPQGWAPPAAARACSS